MAPLGVDHNDAIRLLKARVSQIPNVISQPEPEIEILKFELAGPVLVVRIYCNNDHYWQVYFDTNKAIRETFTQAEYPIPEEQFRLQTISNGTKSNSNAVLPVS